MRLRFNMLHSERHIWSEPEHTTRKRIHIEKIKKKKIHYFWLSCKGGMQ